MPPPAVAALAADRADVVVPFVHLREQQAGILRRVLQVGVQSHYALPAAVLESRQDRHVLAEIAVEQDHPRHIGTLLELLAQDRGGTVAAAVVDEQNLIRDTELVQRRVQPVEQGLQALLFVIDGDDDGKVDRALHKGGILPHGAEFAKSGIVSVGWVSGTRNPTIVGLRYANPTYPACQMFRLP